jgi:long-chain acyl-CoA synthetase
MTDYTPYKIFNELLYENEKNNADMVYLRQPIGGVWHDITWKETMVRARKITAFLKTLGLKRGDKIAILSKNCAEWLIADFAIAMGGFISVPLFASQPANTIKFVLEHAEVKVIFVGKLDNWQAQEPAILDHIIRIAFPYENPMPTKYLWNDILRDYEPDRENYIPNPEDLYTITYTSGTTGNPKGVMITFGAQAYYLQACLAENVLKIENIEDHVYLISYLPLGHIFERMVVESASLVFKTTISFSESIASFARNLEDTSPTVFIAAPRIWSQFQKAILAKLPQHKLDILLKIPILSYFIKRKIRKTLGLSRCVWAVSGSAPISLAVLEWYRKLGITISEGYGRTEDLTYVSFMNPGETAYGSVGKPRPQVEVKLGENDELLTRSKIMMSGYYKDPKATKEAITKDGFLRTGDQARIDKDGFIYILGRVRDPFKTDKGEFVNPIPIEGKFAKNHLIEQLCLIGLTLPQPVLLAVLSAAAMKMPRKEVDKSLKQTLDSINPGLTKFEKVSHIIVVKEPWTPENGLLTPTLKMKRNDIHAHYIALAHKAIVNHDPIFTE